MKANGMKKRGSFLIVLALLLSLCIPASAAQDFGLAYDDTDLLDTDFLRTLAYDTLQPMTNDYDAQFRLDVMSDVSQEEALSVAEYLYEEYDYGDGADKACVLLMLGLNPDDTGLTFRSFALLAKGYAANVVTGQTKAELEALLGTYLNAEMWSGDLETDCHVFETAMTEYTKKLDELFLAYKAAGDTEAPPLTTEPAPAADGSTQTFVYDDTDLLSDSEEASLEDAARAVSQTYGCGVYLAAVDNYLDYSTTSVYEAAKTFYRQNDLGMGESSTGILLFLSMDDRDYWLVAYGDQAHAAFTDYGKEAMAEVFLDNFGNNDWYGGFSDYIDICGEYLSLEEAGTPVDIGSDPVTAEPMTLGDQILGSLLMAVVPALVIATIICLIARAKMKSAKIGTEAQAYVTKNGVRLTVNEDHYLRTTVTRTPRPKNNDHGGGTSIGSDGFSGGGGKF